MGRRGTGVAAIALTVAAVVGVVVGVVLSRPDDDHATPGLTVGWGGSGDNRSCVYVPEDHVVRATIAIDGAADDSHEVRITVGAYADENTSRRVGSSSRTVPVDGTVHRSVVLTIPVSRAPFLDDDGEAACTLDVEQ